jgi:hypothetical protein
MPKFILILLTGFLAATCTVKAQNWELGGTVGAAGYIGDFNPNHPLKFTDPEYGVFLKRNFNGYFSTKINYTHGTIRGADSLSSNQQAHDRNLSFFTSLDEVSVISELNFMEYVPEIGRNKFTPFIFIGVGALKFNPQASYNGQNYDLQPLRTEGEAKPYKELVLTIPYGAGIKYNFSGQWNFIADLGYRTPNTNYLDDVSGAYPNKSLLPSAISQALSDRSGEKTGVYIGSPGSQRGNMRSSDTYMFLGFTISYTFLTSKCYSFN